MSEMEIKNNKNVIYNEINKIVEKYDELIDSSIYELKLNNIIIYENIMKIEILFSKKIYELTEVVSQTIYQSNCNNDECEKQFNELYDMLLDEINDDYAINIDGEIKVDNVIIEFHKLECDGDYCNVGLLIDLSIPLKDINYIKDVMEHILMLFVSLIKLYSVT